MPKDIELKSGFMSINRYRSAVMYRCLKELSARTRYYFERHKQRWEKRYKCLYPECDGEFGTIGNIRWIITEKRRKLTFFRDSYEWLKKMGFVKNNGES